MHELDDMRVPKKLLCLPKPKKCSHKGDNGTVLIIGGSDTYHGAPILAALAASRFCDLVYFSSIPKNNEIIKRMKIGTPNVIAAPERKRGWAEGKAGCIIIGCGMDESAATKRIADRLLKEKRKCVLDAAAAKLCSKNLLHGNAILTPHAKEFENAFGCRANEANARLMSKKYGCTILLKGKEDIIASEGNVERVKGGNAGMTKGGTGDALAGLLGAIFASCDSPFKSAITASAVCKKAGELLFKEKGFFYSSEELAEKLGDSAAILAKTYRKD